MQANFLFWKVEKSDLDVLMLVNMSKGAPVPQPAVVMYLWCCSIREAPRPFFHCQSRAAS